MKLGKRKCKNCKLEFEKKMPLQCICSISCAMDRAYQLKKAKSERESKQKVKEMKEGLLTHASYLKMFQTVFNTYIRLRDKDEPCISCGTTKQVEYAAGHFWPTTYSYLRFNEDNVHKQCNKSCNMMKSGNLLEYRPALIKKIGIERVEWLDENRHKELQLSIPEIIEKIKEYKFKIKELKNGTK